jgi:hypothetical protein
LLRAQPLCAAFFGTPRCVCACRGLAPQCAQEYIGERCALCAPRHYRMRGECIKCPDNAWMLILFALLALIVLGVAGYILNKYHMVCAPFQ